MEESTHSLGDGESPLSTWPDQGSPRRLRYSSGLRRSISREDYLRTGLLWCCWLHPYDRASKENGAERIKGGRRKAARHQHFLYSVSWLPWMQTLWYVTSSVHGGWSPKLWVKIKAFVSELFAPDTCYIIKKADKHSHKLEHWKSDFKHTKCE